MEARFLILAALLVPLSASAQQGGYFGVGLLNWTYDEDNVQEASASAIRITGGSELTENLAIEGQFATGGSDTVPVFVSGFGTVNVDVELDNAFSLMLKPHTGGEDIRGYGLVGFSTGQLTFTANGFSNSESDSGLSYGAGVEAALNEQAWFHVEYVSYLREDVYTFDAVTAGVRFRY